MKKLSAGLILTDGEWFLGCHSTGNWFYDLPKGEVGQYENPKETCIREAKEETNLNVPADHLEDLGVFDYNPKKDLHLFLWKVEDLPDTDEMKCSSYFIHRYTEKETPEVDGYRYIRFGEQENYMTKNMVKVINDVQAFVTP